MVNLRTVNQFHIIAKEVGLKYLIIGGFAASYWGKPRFTADVDYAIEASVLELAQGVLTRLNYKLVFLHPKESFAHFMPSQGGGFRIDFMLVNTATWKQLWEAAKLVDFGGDENYPVVDSLHLIAMKLHAASQPDREEYYKDLNDIVEILLAQNLSYADLQKTGIVEKHGSERTVALLKKIYEARITKVR
jgi:hypothetical protein